MEYTVSIDNKYLRKRKRKVLIHASESFNKSTQSTVVFINELHQLRMQFKSSLHVCVCVNCLGLSFDSTWTNFGHIWICC